VAYDGRAVTVLKDGMNGKPLSHLTRVSVFRAKVSNKPLDPELPIITRYWLNLAISDPKYHEDESFTQFYDIDLNEVDVRLH
jgi:hypothetical protein